MAKIAILRCLLVIFPPYLNVFMQKKKFIIYRRDARKGSSAYSPKPHSAPHFEGHYVEGMEEWASHYRFNKRDDGKYEAELDEADFRQNHKKEPDVRATAERRRITEDDSTAVPANKSSLKRKGNSREEKHKKGSSPTSARAVSVALKRNGHI